MYQLEKTFRFEAAHQLAHHDGKCKNLHGHSYTFTLKLQAEELIATGPKTNMVMDFGDISKIVKSLIETHLDHRFLNDTLQSDSTTAEFIAKWIFDRLKPQIPLLIGVTVFETATSSATYCIK